MAKVPLIPGFGLFPGQHFQAFGLYHDNLGAPLGLPLQGLAKGLQTKHRWQWVQPHRRHAKHQVAVGQGKVVDQRNAVEVDAFGVFDVAAGIAAIDLQDGFAPGNHADAENFPGAGVALGMGRKAIARAQAAEGVDTFGFQGF